MKFVIKYLFIVGRSEISLVNHLPFQTLHFEVMFITRRKKKENFVGAKNSCDCDYSGATKSM